MNIKCNNTSIKITKFDESFPIGCLFFSINSTNPSTLLGGGTWTRIAQGRTLVGLNENDSDFKTAEKTGGEKSHKLTVNEMPSHNHTTNIPVTTVWAGNGGQAYQLSDRKTDYVKATDYIASTGGNGSHNNLQPYYVTYIWKRTA